MLKLKKLGLIVLISSLVIVKGNAQMKIGAATAPAAASVLELESSTQGFVLPRVSLTNITSNAPLGATILTGTMVYSIVAPTGGSGIGIYYWDGAKWNFLATSVPANTYWSLTGNGSTTPGTNFIGTTDPNDFVTKTNSTERMRVFSGGGVGIGTASQLASALLSLKAGSGNAFLSTDNNTNWQAANASNTYEFFLTPRGSDNVTYLNYGLVGFNIRNNSGVSTMFMQNNGYVGIGTTNPATLLHIKSQAAASAFETIDVTTTTQQAGIQLAENGTVKSNIYYDPASATYGTNGALLINNLGASSPNTVINPTNGDAGINTPTPASTIDFRGSFAGQYNNAGSSATASGNGSTTITAASYSISATDYVMVYSGTVNTTFTLPAAVSGIGNYRGRQYYIKNYSSSYIFVNASSGEFIDNNAGSPSTVTIVPFGTMLIVSTGVYTGSSVTAPNWNVLINTTAAYNKQIFTYTGSDQVFIVPPGITSINVKVWGAGGGGGFNVNLGANAISAGGSGGYVSGNIPVTPGQNLLVQVGQGGTSFSSTASQYYYGGGADGGASFTGYASAGAGGGLSGISNFAGTIYYVVAGGGGGGGSIVKSGYGGAGGSTTAGAGGVGATTAAAGGGTGTTGGAAGVGSINGSVGTQFNGGIGAVPTTAFTSTGNDAAGGGGGGGYYGGGGGACTNSSNTKAGGGGGGSSYVIGMTGTVVNTIGTTSNTGAETFPPNSADTDCLYSVGTGGFISGNVFSGGDGEVVIIW